MNFKEPLDGVLKPRSLFSEAPGGAWTLGSLRRAPSRVRWTPVRGAREALSGAWRSVQRGRRGSRRWVDVGPVPSIGVREKVSDVQAPPIGVREKVSSVQAPPIGDLETVSSVQAPPIAAGFPDQRRCPIMSR